MIEYPISAPGDLEPPRFHWDIAVFVLLIVVGLIAWGGVGWVIGALVSMLVRML